MIVKANLSLAADKTGDDCIEINSSIKPVSCLVNPAHRVIIAVMLAFGANNLWDDQALKKDELESLELVLRDLGDSVEELQDFSAYSSGAFDAALGAYSARSKRAPYE